MAVNGKALEMMHCSIAYVGVGFLLRIREIGVCNSSQNKDKRNGLKEDRVQNKHGCDAIDIGTHTHTSFSTSDLLL